jgi:hypothetical protein
MLVQVDRPDGPYQRAFLRLIDTANLRVLSELKVAGFEGADRGAWTGSSVVFGNGYADGESAHPPPLLVRLDARDDRLRVAKIVNLAAPDEDVIFNTVPRVVRSDQAGVVAVFRARQALRELLTCEAAALRCDAAVPLN